MTTPLDAYLTSKNIKDAEFAPLINRDRSMVSKLRHGKVKPTLDLAADMERVTDGAVPMKAWVEQHEPAAEGAA